MSQRSNKAYKWSLVAVMVALLVVVSFIQPVLNRSRADLGLTQITPLENAPPMLAFTTVALGGFRGIIANALWIRANDLQEQGKYFEMMQLADWITKLQPRMVQVWTVQAWNMAYNISVKFNTDADRWRWVKAGTELLRDEGLKYNPDEALIYRELAWFFQHKMGHYLDGSHMYYKEQWAREMMTVFGSEPPNWDALINPQTPEQIEKSKRLREHFKMDPALMKEIDQEYGPLEWKLPEASAIYWATLGLKHVTDRTDTDTLRRVIYQSMDLAFRRGRLTIISDGQGGEQFVPGPNLDIVDKAELAFLEMQRMEDLRQKTYAGYKNFLRTVVYNMYLHGRTKEAIEWWNKMKEKFPDAVRPGLSLDDYVVEVVSEDASGTDQNKTISVLEGLFTTAFMDLAIGEETQAEVNLRLAARVRNRYMQAAGCFDDPPHPDCARIALPPLEVFRDNILAMVLDRNSGLSPIYRARLLTALNLPEDYEPRPNLPPAGAASKPSAAPATPAAPAGEATNAAPANPGN